MFAKKLFRESHVDFLLIDCFLLLGRNMQNGRTFLGREWPRGAASSTEGIYERLYLMQNDSETIVSYYLQLVNVRAAVGGVCSPDASFLINMCNSVCAHMYHL